MIKATKNWWKHSRPRGIEEWAAFVFLMILVINLAPIWISIGVAQLLFNIDEW